MKQDTHTTPALPETAASETPDLSLMKRADYPVIWREYKTRLDALIVTAETLTVTDISQKAEIKLAKVTRLNLKNLRVEIDKRRKELGEDHLREIQRINGDAKKLADYLEPHEERMLEFEKFAEREEARIKAELKASRELILSSYKVNTAFYDLGAMPEQQFQELLSNTAAAHRQKAEEARQAEAAALAAEKAEADRLKALRVENDRLKKEADDREALAKIERDKNAAILKKQQEAAKAEADRRQKEFEANDAKQRAEAKRLKDENDAKLAAQQKIADEAEAKAAEDRKALAKLEQEKQAERDRLDKIEKERIAAEKKLNRAPDKTKLEAFIDSLAIMEFPQMKTPEGIEAVSVLHQWSQNFINAARELVAKM